MTIVGKSAPDFTAKAVIGDAIKDYTLSSNWKRGRYTVLWFYPKDFTFVCPTELLAFDARLKEFEARNCAVVAVSTDSANSHLAWKGMALEDGGIGNISYPLVADLKKEISIAYDVLDDSEGIAFRGLFLIDAKGIVRHMLVNDDALGRSVDEVLRTLDALQYSEKHGVVCPANWHQGEATIKADPKGSKEYFRKAAKAIKPTAKVRAQ
jgi:peroxiredoxin 2/4